MANFYGARGFLLAEAALYAAFLALDFTNTAPLAADCLKYASVVLCLLWRFRRKDAWLRRAEALVLAADLLLLFTPHFAAGILAFLGVQLCYRRYLAPRRALALFWAAAAAAAALAAAAGPDPVLPLAALYAAALLWNTGTALRRPGALFGAALVLLCLCDVHVALWNLPAVPAALRAWAGNAMWLFYLPSQVCAALTAARERA